MFVPLFGAARLCAIQGSGAAEARTARSGHRRDLRSRQDGAAEAKAFGEADFRTAADRTRLRWRLYGREGLRSDRPHPVARGLRAAGPSAWPCAGRFRRMHRSAYYDGFAKYRTEVGAHAFIICRGPPTRPWRWILPCTTVTQLIDCGDVDRSPSVCRNLCGSGPGLPGQAFLTEMSQSCRAEFDWTSAAKDALLCASAGGFGYPPARLGLAPRFAGLGVVRASSPAPRTNGAQTHVVPFHREVPEPQERHTQEGERQIERDNSAQGHPVYRGHRQETAAVC